MSTLLFSDFITAAWGLATAGVPQLYDHLGNNGLYRPAEPVQLQKVLLFLDHMFKTSYR